MKLSDMYLAIITVVVLAATINATFLNEQQIKRDTYEPSSDLIEHIQSCTRVVTSFLRFGCTVTEAAQTSTTTIDCGSCALSTTSAVNTLFGLGPVCVEGRETVLDTSQTATATACNTDD